MLNVTHNIVPCITHGTPSKRGQLIRLSHTRFADQSSELTQRVRTFEGLFFAATFNLHFMTCGGHRLIGPNGQKTVTPNFLTTDHTLEKASRATIVEAFKRRDRGQSICQQLTTNRNQVEVACEFFEF